MGVDRGLQAQDTTWAKTQVAPTTWRVGGAAGASVAEITKVAIPAHSSGELRSGLVSSLNMSRCRHQLLSILSWQGCSSGYIPRAARSGRGGVCSPALASAFLCKELIVASQGHRQVRGA